MVLIPLVGLGHDVETLQLQIDQLTAERDQLGTTPIPMKTIGRLVTLAVDSGRMDDAIRYALEHSQPTDGSSRAL